MEIIVGKYAGFCAGVTNAVVKTEEALKENSKIYCLGELIHNNQVMQKLQEHGLIVIDDLKEIKEKKKIIVRAHGIPKQVYKQADENGLELIDLTCPKVLNIHKKVEEYVNNGYYIFLVGEKKHPEIVGTYSFCSECGSIIEKMEYIDESIEIFKNSKYKKVVVISQTTFSSEKFDKIADEIRKKIPQNIEVIIDKTICNATDLRQKETSKISKEVDLMIIIGGKNSSNTKKLYEISKENCKNVLLIETKEELDMEYIKKFNKVGIMAGASTPKWIIEEVSKCI